MRSIAVANQKGGVGKTTSAVHLAHGLALAGRPTVLLDLDPQGNATLAVQAMEQEHPAEVAEDSPLQRLTYLGTDLWILPSPGAHRPMPRTAALDVQGLIGLTRALEAEGIEFLVVDCPPRMDQWGWAGLQLSQQVLVPVPPEFFAMHGLSQMMETLQEAAREFPGRAELLGVVVTLFDARETVALEVLADLQRNLGDRLLRSRIYRDPKLVEAASFGKTLFEYNVFARGSRAYGELVREVLDGRP